MKRTKIDFGSLGAIPCELGSFMEGAQIFDSSCSPEARVYFIDRDGGYYLKRSSVGALEKEAKMTAYFHSKGLSCEVLSISRSIMQANGSMAASVAPSATARRAEPAFMENSR